MKVLKYIVLLAICTGSVYGFPNSQLEGTVVNASKDSTAVANLTVFLQSMKTGDTGPVDVGKTSTNGKGQFVFPIAQPDTAASYFAAVDFNGVRFYSQGTNPAEQNIVVYDTTHSAESLSSMMHHLIVEDMGNMIQVRETRVYHNGGDKAITNVAHDEKAGDYTIKYQLPSNAFDFTPMSANFSNQHVQEGRDVFDKSILLPGTRQLSYAYRIPYRNGRVAVDLGFDAHTRSFDVFLKSQNLSLVSADMQDFGPFKIRNAEYKRYGIEGVHAGQTVAFQIVQQSLPNKSPLPTVLLTAALLMVILVVGHFRENGTKAK